MCLETFPSFFVLESNGGFVYVLPFFPTDEYETSTDICMYACAYDVLYLLYERTVVFSACLIWIPTNGFVVCFLEWQTPWCGDRARRLIGRNASRKTVLFCELKEKADARNEFVDLISSRYVIKQHSLLFWQKETFNIFFKPLLYFLFLLCFCLNFLFFAFYFVFRIILIEIFEKRFFNISSDLCASSAFAHFSRVKFVYYSED